MYKSEFEIELEKLMCLLLNEWIKREYEKIKNEYEKLLASEILNPEPDMLEREWESIVDYADINADALFPLLIKEFIEEAKRRKCKE